MKSNYIFRFISLFFLAIIFRDDRAKQLSGVDGALQLQEGESDWLLAKEELNCVVKGEGHQPNPSYCWATKGVAENPWPLCYPAVSDEDVPKWLEDIVKVDGDGV